jgi:signal transduction histidine kinase
MQHLLGAVREISHLDAQLEDEERTSVKVSQILKQVIEARRLRGDSSVSVHLIENTSSFVVSMAPERLTQVLENLLENALSFASSEVRIKLYRSDAYGVIDLEDDGPGIPEPHLEKIFNRFFSYRPNEAIPESSGLPRHHLGLGLAIVKAIVQGYGGKVKASNGSASIGQLKGANIVVQIPVVNT